MFKINTKGTRRRRSSVFIVNFEEISHFFSFSIVDFEQVNICWACTLVVVFVLVLHHTRFKCSGLAFACLKLVLEALEQGVKYVQS